MHHLLHSVSTQLKQSRTLKHGALVPLALFLAACTTTQMPPLSTEPTRPVAVAAQPVPEPVEPPGLRSLITLQDRLYRVAAPMLVNGTDLCKGNARKLLGFSAKNKYSYSNEYVDAAQKVYGFDDRLRITSVLAGSGAASAGIRTGDVLVAVEDKPMPVGDSAERQAARILTPLVTPRTTSLKLTLIRNGATLNIKVPLTIACAFPIELGNTDNVNACGDGRRILVTRGMMNFAQSDDQLAFVLAKELAHNALDHAKKQRMNATMGGIIDNLILNRPDMQMMVGMAGVRPLPQDLDAAADTLSLYWLTRAGRKPDGAIAFWRDLANRYPASVANSYTAIHPATEYRMISMERNLAILREKQAGNKPLNP